MAQAMLDAFITHERSTRRLPDTHNIIGMTPGTRCYRIIRGDDGWRVWTATRDFIHGSYIELHNDGSAYRWECRPDEGDECIMIRPDDAEVHYRWSLRQSDHACHEVAGVPTSIGLQKGAPTQGHTTDNQPSVGITHVNLNPDNDRLDEINQQQPDTE